MHDAPHLLSLPMTAAYYRLIMRRFGGDSGSLAALRADTEAADELAREASPDVEIPVRSQLRQLANLHAIAPADWGLELGATLDVVTHGPSGLVAVTAASLGAALDAVARYMTVRTPFVDLRLTRDGQRVALRVVEPCAVGSVRTSLLEMVLLSLQATMESALGTAVGAAVTFTMPAPRPAYWRHYDRVFHAPVVFSGHTAEVSLPAAWLSLPCPLADPVAHRGTMRRLDAMQQRLIGDFVEARVERIFEQADGGGPTLAALAAQLQLSPRTLVRRLGERDTSYRILLDSHRRRRSRALLAQPALSVAEIAERLGYDAPGNFARACRRWFGVSPRRYRARLGDPEI
ncbi:MAG: AraC family transcriptional regulator ligand-binding domain-containing protein [bacterium]